MRADTRLRHYLMIGFGLLLAADAPGQNVPQHHFEVVSIKVGGDTFSTRPNRSLGRLRWTTEMNYLIGYAYGLDFSRISGAQLADTYTVEATFDPAATDGEVRLMMQALLADRFRMRSHRVVVETDGYALSVGKGGLRMKPSEQAESYVSATSLDAGTIAIQGHGASIPKLAETLQRVVQLPIWDRTGLAGTYDFTFRYAQDVSADRATDAPALATALRESLGLNLAKQKGPLETLVIDSIEKPSEN